MSFIGKFIDQPVLSEKDGFTVDKTDFSPFFIFKTNETLQTLHQRWSFFQYLKVCWQRNTFAKTNGTVYFFKDQTFIGRYASNEAQEQAENAALVTQEGAITPTRADEMHWSRLDFQNTQGVKAYVSIPSKTPEYDLVLGELNRYKQIVTVHRCRKNNGNPVQIIRESKIRTKGGTVITAMIYEAI